MNAGFSQKFLEIGASCISAAGFLSRLPLNGAAERLSTHVGEEDFAETTRYFAIAAIIVALPSALVGWLTGTLGLAAMIVASLAIIAHTMATGALHEDGLADMADGFGGGQTREDKLQIMRDSRIGTYGASALILTFLLQMSLYANLFIATGAGGFPLIIIAGNIASTTVMTWPWAVMPPARQQGGLSANHGQPSRSTAIFANLLGLSLAALLLWVATGLIPAIIAIAVCVITMMGFLQICDRRIGGHTGDTLGATKKLSELGLLLALTIAT